MKNTILKIDSLHKQYGKGKSTTTALGGVNLKVLDGEFVAIMGESGSGKSTLLNCIATTISPSSGSIYLNGENILDYGDKELSQYRGDKVGYLFQNYELIDNLTARENILLPVSIHNKLNDKYKNNVESMCRYFGLDNLLDKFPNELSGGEKQRIAVVRSLSLDPILLLADEPTGALDSKNSSMLLETLSKLNIEHQKSILMVTHNANAASFCSRIIFIQDGVVFHELRRKTGEETQQDFYKRILEVMSRLLGGSANVIQDN